LEFGIYLRFGAWDLLFEKLVLGVWNFIHFSTSQQLAIFPGKAMQLSIDLDGEVFDEGIA
jgi:hypothetical protein